MRFTKMQGAGNDYIYVDCFYEPLPHDTPDLARRIADRRFGVGGDGLILICPSDQADAEMRMYNADGSAAEMCGNGIRCVAKYVYDHGICQQDTLRIESGGNVRTLELTLEGGRVQQVRVDMGPPILTPAAIPTTLRSPAGPEAPVIDTPIELGGRTFNVTCVSMGNPHCVTWVEEPTDDWVLGIGPNLEVDSHFPKRVNCRVRPSPQPIGSRTAHLGAWLRRNTCLWHGRVRSGCRRSAHGANRPESGCPPSRRRPKHRMERSRWPRLHDGSCCRSFYRAMGMTEILGRPGRSHGSQRNASRQ